jgi:hypothetical protein
MFFEACGFLHTNWTRRNNYKRDRTKPADKVQRMAEGRLPKIALKWMPKQKKSTEKTEEELDGRNKEGHERKKSKRRPVGR